MSGILPGKQLAGKEMAMGNNPLERFESMVLRGIENEEAETFDFTLRGVSEVVTTPLSR